jgi:hypothetical protein
MTRTIARLLIVFSLSLSGSTCLAAQSLSADQFLQRVSAHAVGDEVERDQSTEVYESLSSALPAEVERAVPTVLQYTRSGNEGHARLYAALFLTAIAMRPDGAALLSSRSEEISSLILDTNPGIQRGALAAMDFVIAKRETNNKPYLSALLAAIQKTQTPQDAGEEMLEILLTFGRNNPDVLKSALAFMQREDLTRTTRMVLVSHLGLVPGLPTEVNRALTKELGDPDPWVRAAAVVAFADSTYEFYTTEFHILAKDCVARMANDPQENPKVRELAQEAIAGKTHLDPNALVPKVVRPPDKPNDH